MVNSARALIYGRNAGAPYHPLAAVAPEVASILEPAFDVVVSDRREDLLGLAAVAFDLLVGLDDVWTEPLDRAALDAVDAWVRRGGRLLLIHNGICWARDARWRRLAGGRFTGHAPAKTLSFVRRASMGGDADAAGFELFEEPYRFSVPGFSGDRILAEYEDGGRRYPAAWTRRAGRGRISYFLPGHTVDAFRVPAYRRWLAAAATESARL
jgi:type 1 glutamine amidotransferase